MIRISAGCRDCDWAWKTNKRDGPDLDFLRAKSAAEKHSRTNPGHTAEAVQEERETTARGSSIRFLSLEITRG